MKMWLFFQKPNMAEGEATPVVEAKRLVERDDEGMSQSYHETFDTQVEWTLDSISCHLRQGYRREDSSPCTITSPQEGSSGSGVSGETETGTVLDVAASGGQVLTRKNSWNIIYQSDLSGFLQ